MNYNYCALSGTCYNLPVTKFTTSNYTSTLSGTTYATYSANICLISPNTGTIGFCLKIDSTCFKNNFDIKYEDILITITNFNGSSSQFLNSITGCTELTLPKCDPFKIHE